MLTNAIIMLLGKKFKKCVLFLILYISAAVSFAQPPNDDPCTATLLTPSLTCNYQVFSTIGATASAGITAPDCANYQGGDIWFKAVVPCSGNLSFDTNFGVVADGGMAAYSGNDCSNLTLLSCDDNSSANGLMPLLTLTGLTYGDTIWVRFWEAGNNVFGTMGICAGIPPSPPPGASCPNAGPFCTGTTYDFPNSYNVPSLGGGDEFGCLGSTPNPVFYYMQIQNPGNLTIHMSQENNSGNGLDVDFACWGPFSDLPSICTGLTAANNISCSFSGAPEEDCIITNAQAGEFYMLLITNFSNQPGFIHFEQSGGTASTNCGILCNVTSANTGPVCPGETVSLSSTLTTPVPGGIYTWSGPNCFSSNVEDPGIITPPSTPGSYDYTITVATGTGTSCTSTTTVIVSNGLSGGTVTPGNTSCAAATDGSITVNPPASGGPFTFTLNPGNIVHNNSNPGFTGLPTGVYSILISNGNCDQTISNITIEADPEPIASAVPANTSCPGADNGTITISPPAVGGPFIYTLNPGNIVHNNNPVYSNLAPGTYTITFTNAAGCNGTLTTDPAIADGSAPVASADAENTSCPTLSDGTITITPPATNGPFIYTLNPGNVVQNNNPLFTGLAAATYTITFTNALGCSGTVSSNPVIQNGPALIANAPTLFNPPCANINDGSITIVPSVAGNYTYILNPGTPGQINNGNNPTFTGLPPGNYTYSFTNAIGCIGTGNATLTTNSPIGISIAKTMPLCFSGSDGVITLTASGGLPTYKYALSPFVNYQASGTFNNLTAGSYIFRVKDNAGCTKDTSIVLSQPTQLSASASSNAATCNGNDGNITVTGNAGSPGYTYSIDGINYQASPDFQVAATTVIGTTYANITVQDNNGCIAPAAPVTVIAIDNMLPLFIGNDTTICAEQQITFHPQTSNEADHFTWTTLPNAASSTLDNDTIKNATAIPIDTTIYILNAYWGVCNRIDSILVNLLHKPVPYAGEDTAVCFDKTIALLHGTAGNLSGSVSYEWSDTTNLEYPHQAITAATPPETEVFTLTVTDNYGCNFSVTDQVTVIVQPPVPAFAGNDTIAVIKQAHQLLATGGTTYIWSPAAPLNFSDIANPLATLDHDQLFHVIVIDKAGCIGSDDVFIQVYPGPAYHVPNAFSPNGDGLNDIFRVIPAGIAYTEWFRIFNRYGEMIFETNQWLKGWDGTFQGKKQPMGTYVWVLKGVDKNGRKIEMKGTVVIVQ